jgi:hypothetical protein
MIRVVLVLVLIALLVYAFTDCAMSDDASGAGVPKVVWLAVIVLVPVVGPLTWLLVSRTTGARPGDPQQRRRQGPVAPDDDPEFLGRLAEQNRRSRGDGTAGGSDTDRPA